MQRGAAERERPYLRDPDDPEYIKDLQRPAVIKEDLSEMERRKRVQEILESKSFCQELEEVIRQECDSARSDPDHLQTLQRLSDLTISHGSMSFINLHAYAGNAIQIADLGGNQHFTKIERIQRNKLACLFRLADLFQWSQGIHNEISYRADENGSKFLINPHGLLFHEITASTLITVDNNGEILDSGSLRAQHNQKAFSLHSVIYKARPDVKCILRMHTAVVAAVASMKCGLLPLCQEAMVIGDVGYHDFMSIESEELDYDKLIDNLGNKNVLFLRNRGFLIVGNSIEHATYIAYNTVLACETQVLIMRGDWCLVAGESIEEVALLMRSLEKACDHQVRAARAGIENLIIPNERSIRKTYNDSRSTTNSLKRNGKSTIEWKVGELEWESWMRVLDHANFRTGHIYRQPQLRPRSAMSTSTCNNNEVALPPSSSAYGQIDESDSESVANHRLALLRKEQERIRWLSSPSNYQKIEFLEYGADYPKKITKWVQDSNSPSASGTPVKINNVHHFSPASTNPKEFKDKQKSIRENSRLGTNTAGPQSQVLGNVTYEDLSLIIKADADGNIGPSSTSDRAILIGTASKGIIDKSFQHHAQVYHQIYAPNPFAVETDEDIKKYIAEVGAKISSKRPLCTTSKSDYDYSQYDDNEGVDSASLMQGGRERKLTNNAFSSDDGLNSELEISKQNDDTNDSNVDTSYLSHSVVLDYFPSSAESASPVDIESDAKHISTRKLTNEDTATSRSFTTGSEDDSGLKSEKKKKKKGLFSFIRKKDKSTPS